MNRSARFWLHQSPLFLAGGIVLLILLPGGQSSTVNVKQATSLAKPATAVSQSTPILARPITVALKSGGIDDRTSLVSASGLSNTSSSTLPGASTWWADYRLVPPSALAKQDSAALTEGRVGAQAVNARSGPAANADRLFVLAAGEPVKLGETSTGWVHIYRQSGESGWVYSRYLAGQPTPQDARQTPAGIASNPVPTRKDNPAKNLALIQFPMAVLAEPSEDAALLVVLRPGDRVRFAETRGPWVRVVTEDGISGWVPS